MTILDSLMAPLQPWLTLPNLLELGVVESGYLCLEFTNQCYKRTAVSDLTYEFWERLCYVLANASGQIFDIYKQPRLSVRLPQGHRMEAMLGPQVRNKLSISIRIKNQPVLALKDFGLDKEQSRQLSDICLKGSNVLITGGTNSGKTTLLNILLNNFPKKKKILIIEDTQELNLLKHHYWAQYLISRNDKSKSLTYADVIDHILRSRPDIIVVGEISIENAYAVIRLLNSGHAGFFCTIHANSPLLAIEGAFPQNIELAGIHVQGVSALLRQCLDVVIQVQQTAKGARAITDIMYLNKLAFHKDGLLA